MATENGSNGKIKAAKIEGWLEQFEKRVFDELGNIKDELKAIKDNSKKDIDEHLQYHKENEHKFGIIKYFSLNPTKLILLGFLLCFLLISIIGVSELWDIIKAKYFKFL